MSNPYARSLPAAPDLAQQKKRAKELLKAVRANDAAALARVRYSHPRLANADGPEICAAQLHDTQWVIAREYGFASWLKLKAHIDEITEAQRKPYRLFDTNLQYYRDRASGLRSVFATGERNALRLIREFHPTYARASDHEVEAADLTQADAELVLAREHGFNHWDELAARVDALRADASIEPFKLAFDAIEAQREETLAVLLRKFPDLAHASGTNGNRLLHFAVNHDNAKLTSLLLEADADPDAANDKGSTPLTQAAYRGKVAAIEQLLAEGASVDAEAYGDGGTPLAFALFWGHREAAERLAEVAVVPRNLRIAAGLGRLDIMAEMFDASGKLTPEAGFHREFHRPHSGFPPWQPTDDPQQVIDEALNYAARSGRIEAMALLFERGADLDRALRARQDRTTGLHGARTVRQHAAVTRCASMCGRPARYHAESFEIAPLDCLPP